MYIVTLNACYEQSHCSMAISLMVSCIHLLTANVDDLTKQRSHQSPHMDGPRSPRTPGSMYHDESPRQLFDHSFDRVRLYGDMSAASSMTSVRTGEINVDDMSIKPRPAPRRKGEL